MSSFKNNAREKSVMPVEKDRRSSLYYGWYIVAASFVILFFNAGSRFAISVMFKPLIAEFGWSRGTLSLAFLLNMTVYAISLLFVGRFYDRYGPKWVLIISTLFLSAGFMSIFLVTSLWQFFICYGVLAAIGMGGTAVNFLAAVTSKWFKTRRGLAVSLALSGSCIGQFALVFGFTFFITAPLTPTLIGRLFGLTHIGLIGGVVTTIHHLGGGLWAYVGGVIFDHTGSYRWAFAISMFMAGAAVLCALLIKEERHEPRLGA